MPPMLPICMSTMTRSGDSSVTKAMTSGPEVTEWTVTSGPLMTASTSRRRVGASLATRMVCTWARLSDRGRGAIARDRSGRRSGEHERSGRTDEAKRWSAVRSSASRSCTSWPKRGIRPTGAGDSGRPGRRRSPPPARPPR